MARFSKMASVQTVGRSINGVIIQIGFVQILGIW